MGSPQIAKLLTAVARALEPLGVRWYVFGAQAVVAAGVVRFTADIDVTTEDVPAEVLLRALEGVGFGLRRDIAGLAELVEHHRILPLEDKATGFHLDVVRAGPGIEDQMLQRPIRRRIGRTTIPFVNTSDLVALKILAGRPKDLEDVRALLRANTPELRLEAVREVLSELGATLDDSTFLDSFERELAAVEPRRKPSRRQKPKPRKPRKPRRR